MEQKITGSKTRSLWKKGSPQTRTKLSSGSWMIMKCLWQGDSIKEGDRECVPADRETSKRWQAKINRPL